MHEMHLVFIVLGLALIFFVWGKFRYDIVAVVALLSLTLVGAIPVDEAFYGFGHPAVITVAAVLIISRSLENAGIVDMIVRLMSRAGNRLHYQMAALVSGVTLCSAFMNNIGALALFMPVSLRVARKSKASPSIFLMPLAFGSLLGGLMTQIGTLPNIIISLFREDILPGSSFGMFDFLPVGAVVAAVLMLLTGVVGLRELFGSIDWPVIALLGAMLPTSKSMETTGGAAAVGGFLYGISGDAAPWLWGPGATILVTTGGWVYRCQY